MLILDGYRGLMISDAVSSAQFLACKMAFIELIDNLARGFHNIHSTRRIRMATERHLVIAYGQLQFLASDCSNCCVLDLAPYVLLRLIGMPGPVLLQILSALPTSSCDQSQACYRCCT
jgi:hypothetical protein